MNPTFTDEQVRILGAAIGKAFAEKAFGPHGSAETVAVAVARDTMEYLDRPVIDGGPLTSRVIRFAEAIGRGMRR